MSQIVYTVIATIPDEAAAREYVQWLLDGHVSAVVAGGAASAEVVRHDGEPARVESRYVFADRGAFERYEREAAPALRADGAARWPSRGVTFERMVGVLIASENA